MVNSKIECAVTVEYTRFAFIFFPIATYARINDESILTIFRIPVYRMVGTKYQWLWFKPKEK